MIERIIRRAGFGFILLLVLAASAGAAPDFPALTGRVVDRADILSAEQQQQLAGRLETFERRAGGKQLVVVTLASLQGYSIEDYGYQLGRFWGIGQQQADNGLLLIVAPEERKVRIEVGYGLEGEVTDAIAANIIQTRILPRFRQGDYPGGIDAGVTALIEVFGDEYQMQPVERRERQGSPLLVPLIFFVIFVILSAFGGGGGGWGGRRRGGPWIYGGGFGGRSGGFGGGGFSGGGGGFGGGGASGSW